MSGHSHLFAAIALLLTAAPAWAQEGPRVDADRIRWAREVARLRHWEEGPWRAPRS